MRPVGTILLPIERARQLKSVADARGSRITDLIEAIVTGAILAGEIPDSTPGFKIEPSVNGGVTFATDDGQLGFAKLTAIDGLRIADALEAISTGGKGKVLEITGQNSLVVARKGQGVVLLGRDAAGAETGRRTITPSLARDLARQLRAAAFAA